MTHLTELVANTRHQRLARTGPTSRSKLRKFDGTDAARRPGV